MWSRVAKTAICQTAPRRFFHTPAPARKWVQVYDQQIAAKYPNILKVIKSEMPLDKLNATERAAYYVATFKTGGKGGHKIRQKERRLNFEAQVDALVGSWRNAEFLQRKEARRVNITRKAKSQRLSTYQQDVNAFMKIL